jgi:hypothetical protein
VAAGPPPPVSPAGAELRRALAAARGAVRLEQARDYGGAASSGGGGGLAELEFHENPRVAAVAKRARQREQARRSATPS